ncbi:MAG TPA: hypothetical protein VFP69_20070 [Streptomyces sp.]|nr:hypothetical protein [Streptomyces sp.]
MKFTPGSAISVTAAPHGSFVKIAPDDINKWSVVAWSVVCRDVDEDGRMDTDVQPVFVVNGHAYTTSDWYRTEGPERGITVLGP